MDLRAGCHEMTAGLFLHRLVVINLWAMFR